MTVLTDVQIWPLAVYLAKMPPEHLHADTFGMAQGMIVRVQDGTDSGETTAQAMQMVMDELRATARRHGATAIVQGQFSHSVVFIKNEYGSTLCHASIMQEYFLHT